MTELRIPLPPKMRPIAEQRARHKIARGGRGSGKSWSVARLLAVNGIAKRQRWLCCREVQKSIRESSHRLLADQIEALGLSRLYDVQRDVIRGPHGTEFVFAGLQDHTADSIKSYEGFDGAWIEEAHTVSERSANILIPTIRNAGSELIWTYNPDQESDYIHQLAERPDANTLVVDINWRDNPWFPVELDIERRKMQALNQDLYLHIWEGQCRSAAGLIFKRDWFRWYDRLPDRLNLYVSSDYAVTPEADADGRSPDWSEHGVWGLDPTGDLYAVDWWSGQTDPDTSLRAWIALCKRHRPIMAFDEKGVILRSIEGARNKLMRETGVFTALESLASAGNKAARAMGFAARAAAGTVWLPREEWAERLVNQLCAFNGEPGRVDDMVDVCSLIGRGLDLMADAYQPKQAERPKPPTPFTDDWLTQRERADARDAESNARYYA